MNAICITVLTFVALVQKSQCSELDDEIDVKLSDPTTPEPSLPRYFADIGSFVSNIDLISYTASILNNDVNSYFLAFPSKAVFPVYVNLTTQSAKAVFGNLALIGLGAYLLSFIPVGEANEHQNRNDYFEPDLGYGQNRDTEIFFDEFGNEITDYDYQYPDSIDFGSFSSFSSASEPKITTRKIDGEPVNRKGDGRSVKTKKAAKSLERPGILEDLSSKFWTLFGSPVKRAGNSASDGFGIEKILHRYEDYWKRRRSGILKKSSNIEENTFRHKDRKSGAHQYAKPSAPIPYGQDESYHYPTTHGVPGLDTFVKGPSWPGQNTENKNAFGDTDIEEVYGNHFGVDDSNADNPVEYVYSQK